jgi:hypothetical protein
MFVISHVLMQFLMFGNCNPNTLIKYTVNLFLFFNHCCNTFYLRVTSTLITIVILFCFLEL